ncbi:MAG: hypothetical protein EOP83_02905, partial [Verrucomicrobiaceae bacterium]
MTSTLKNLSIRTALVSLSVHTVVAANGTWTNPAGGSWADTNNWLSGVVAGGSDSVAYFSTLDLAANATVTLDGDRTVRGMLFADTAPSNGWVLNAGTAGTLTLADDLGTPVLSVADGTTQIGAVVAGISGVQKNGAGTLLLSGANTFTGNLTVSAGTLRIGNAAALGAGGAGNETVIGSAATFDVNGQAITNTEIIKLAGTLLNTGGEQQNALNRVVLTGNSSVGGTARFDIRPGTAPTLDLAGFTLTKTGTNQFSLVGAVVTPGNVVINGGIFGVETTTTADATGTITINSAGVLGLWANVAGSVLRPVVSNNGTIQNLGSNATLNSPISITSGTALTVTGTATTYIPGIVSGTGNLIKNGTGAFTFGGANTFVGKTTINQGYFGITGEGIFGPAPAAYLADHITLANGATGGIGNVVNGFYYGLALGATRGITIAESGGGIDAYGHEGGRSTIQLNGIVSGPGQFIKTGGGSVAFDAVNTYAGGTQVVSGPLITENIGAINIVNYQGLSTGDLTFTNTGSITGAQFSTTGTLANNIVLNSNGTTNRFYVSPGRVATLSGVVSGGSPGGGILQVDGGTLVLPGTHTYTSATRVGSGTLLVNGSLPDSDVTVASGGTIGGSGSVKLLTLSEGSRIIPSATPLLAVTGVYADKDQGGKGVDVLVTDAPATPGTRTIDVLGYGDDIEGYSPGTENFYTGSYRAGSFADDTVNNKITFTYTNSARTWNTADGIWDVGVTTSWLEDDQKFFQGDAVTFGNPAAAATVTLTGVLAPSAVVVNNTNNYLFGGTGTIASGSLTKSGTGMLVLPGANTYPGGTTINGGTVSLSSTATALGGNPGALGTGPVTVNTSGILKLWVSNTATSYYPNPITLNGGKILGEDGINVLNAPVTVDTLGGTVSAKWNNKNLVFGKTVSGPGKLTVQRETPSGETGAAVFFTTPNTYSGGTDLFSGFIRIANSDQALGTGPLTFTGSATLATAFNGGARSISNPVVVNSGVAASFDAGNFPLTLTGEVSGAGAVTMASSGTLALAGNNSYEGGTNLNSTGFVRLDSTGALGTIGTITFGGGVLQYTATNTTDYSARFSAAGNQAYKADTNGQNVTWASPLTSAGGGITKSGSGKLTLTGASTFTGASIIQAGVLETALLSDTGATPIGTFSTAGASYIGILGGGTFRYTGSDSVTTTRYLWVDQGPAIIDIADPAAVVTINSTAGNITRDFTKAGAGALTIVDVINGTAAVIVNEGRLNLTATNTYTGNTTVNAGTLSLATASLADAADVSLASTATLELNHVGTDTVDQFFINGVEMAKGTWGGLESTATNKTAQITGTGILNVVTGPTGGGAYDSWATATGLTDANKGKALDPDGDGMSNLGEFAFDSLPLAGATSGKIVSKVATIGGEQVLTLTLPVRTGATFTGATVKTSQLIDGVVYRIQG